METNRLLDEVQATHPWLRFEFPWQQLRPEQWVHLGGINAALRFLVGMPLQPRVAEELRRVYLAKGALATTAIEGNTLTEDEARAVIEGQLKLPPSKEYLRQEVLNIVTACNEIGRQIGQTGSATSLTPALIAHFNGLVLAGDVPHDPEAVPGEFRDYNVGVGNVYRAVDARYVRDLVSHLCTWLNGEDFIAASPEFEPIWAVIKAVLAHLYLAWIHPFGDGNGRTARLVEFYLLQAGGAPTPAAHLLSNHYNQTRSRYYEELDRASKSGGDLIPFLGYAIRGLVDELGQLMQTVQAQQVALAWQQYVHTKLGGARSPTAQRREALVLALPPGGKTVNRSEIPLLTPAVAAEYGPKGKSAKTVSRDLNALLELELIAFEGKKQVRARQEVMTGFLVTPLVRASV